VEPTTTNTADCTEALVAYARELTDRLVPSDIIQLGAETWLRGEDGAVRREQVMRPSLAVALHRQREGSSTYQEAAQAVRDDPDFRPLIGGMVGDQTQLSIFNEQTVIYQVAASVLDDDGHLSFDEGRIRNALLELREYVNAPTRPSTILIPLPGLKSVEFPVVVVPGVEIDVLTDDEIDVCASCGALAPMFPGPMENVLRSEDCIGVRITIDTPARTVAPGAEPGDMTKAIEAQLAIPHRFGERSYWRWTELVEDVLVVLRLARPEFIGTKGAVIMQTSQMARGYSWTTRASRMFIGTAYFIDDSTRDAILSLWGMARSTEGQRLPQICLRRFNAAMDRTSLDDAVIDHLISAEALLLKDAGRPEDRGELGFRLALRGSLLLEPIGRNRRQTFKFLKAAYDVRSRIAHGGTVGPDVHVAGRGVVPAGEFLEELGNLMRDALKAALEHYATDPTFATAGYWETLILGPPTS